MTRFFASCLLFVLAKALYASPLQTLLDEIEKVRTEHSISAVGLTIIEDGELIFVGGMGQIAHSKNDTAVDENTIYRIGSITKSFTAIAAMQLAEQKRINIDQPIIQWLPSDWITNPWRVEYPITVAQLLEHSAGFAAMSREEFDLQNIDQLPLDLMLERFKSKHDARWPPGHHHSYSNLGSAFVGRAIEVASNMAFEEYLQKNIFSPLAMNDSRFFLEKDELHRFALGYDTDGVTEIPYWHMSYRPFGGMNTTPKDMGHFLTMLLQNGRYDSNTILREPSLERMKTPQTTLANNASIGLLHGYGLGIYPWFNRGHIFFGHGGDADGYLSRYAFSQNLNSGYFHVITAFNHRAHNKIRALIEDFLLRNQPRSHFPKRHKLSQRKVEKITGSYVKASTRFGSNNTVEQKQDSEREAGVDLRIVEKDSRIYSEINGKQRQLIPVSEHLFRRKNESRASIAIFEHKNGWYYQGNDGNFLRLNLQ